MDWASMDRQNGNYSGAPGTNGVGWSKQKVITVTGTIASNTTIAVNASGTNYTVSGDTVTLGESQALFNANIPLAILDNGMTQSKGDDVLWISANEMQINRILDAGDKITIITT